MVANVVFFGIELRRQPIEPGIGNPGHADLPALGGGRIRLDAGQPLEDRALARTRETGKCLPS